MAGSSEVEETSPDLLRNTPSNIRRLADEIQRFAGRQKYLAQTRSPSDGGDVRWYFCKIPLGENELAAAVPQAEVVGKSDYFRFGMRDSLAIEASFLQREEELLSSWWKEYAECSEGPRGSLSSNSNLGPQNKLHSIESTQSAKLYADEEERVGVPVKGGLYEVDLLRRHCFPVYWNGENRRVLRGHWFGRKGTLDWLPLREDVAEQLEFAYRSQVWHRRTYQPSGLFAARVDLQGSSPGLHALFTGEDDTWEAWLSADVSGFSNFVNLGGNDIKLRRGYAPPHSPKPTQDELRQWKEEEMDDYCSQVPVKHLVFMVHGIGQRLEKANLVDDVSTFRHITEILAERHLTSHQRGTQRVLFIPCQWRKDLKLSSESAVEKITLDGVRGLRVMLGATVHDVLYYMSPIYCQDIIDSVSNQLNKLYLKFLKRNPCYDGKVSLYGHSLGSVLSYDILCHQETLSSPFPMDWIYKDQIKYERPLSNTCKYSQCNSSSNLEEDLITNNGSTSTVAPVLEANVDIQPDMSPVEDHFPVGKENAIVQSESPLIEDRASHGEYDVSIPAESSLLEEHAPVRWDNLAAESKSLEEHIPVGKGNITADLESSPDEDYVPFGSDNTIAQSESSPHAELASAGRDNMSPQSGSSLLEEQAEQSSSPPGLPLTSDSDEHSGVGWHPKKEENPTLLDDVADSSEMVSLMNDGSDECKAVNSKVLVGNPNLGDEEVSHNDKDKTIISLREEIDILNARLKELESQYRSEGHKKATTTINPSVSEILPSTQNDALNGYTPYINYTKLEFKVDTFFAVGSPLGVFLSLRNVRIGIGKGKDYWEDENINEEMPCCRQMFNIFHPFDPVAYRIEPLVCKEYINKRPVIIPYHRGGKRLHIGFQEFVETFASRSQAVIDHMNFVKVKILTLCHSRNNGGLEEATENEDQKIEKSYGSMMMEMLTGSEEGRIDHVLQDKTFQHQYISAVGAHTNYWRDMDTALFILKHLYRDIPDEPETPHKAGDSSSRNGSSWEANWDDQVEREEEELPLTFADRMYVKEFSRKAKKIMKQ